MSTFHEFLTSLGLMPGRIVPDETVRRCPTKSHPRKKNGAYLLGFDGKSGFGQDWSVHPEPIPWKADSDREAIAPTYDPSRMREEREKARREQRAAVVDARKFYDEAAPLLYGHPYLEAHGLDMTGCRGLKVDDEGWMVVPAQRRGRIMTVQRIAPDSTKRFWPGAPAKAATYMIHRQGSTVTVLCEGLATGLALYACLPLASVLVCFSTSNMTEEDVHARIPPGMVVVAADNDWKTAERIGSNPGIDAATEAAEMLGCGVAVPEGMEGSDFADLRQERLAERVAKKLPEQRESELRRAVDASIRAEVMREARLKRVPKTCAT